MGQKNIVVVGAGVAGLTTAFLLSRNRRYAITIAAKHMPGDYDIEYASPWAGANWTPMSFRNTETAHYEKNTWASLEALARHRPEAGVHFQTYELYTREQEFGKDLGEFEGELHAADPWWKDIVSDFRAIPKSELPPGIATGRSFTSVCINTALYLPWLVSQCLKNGVILKRATFKHISDASLAGVHHSGGIADVVINCTGLSASVLGGVEDKTVIPARGQIVLVRNNPGKMVSVSGTDDDKDDVWYFMTRAAGGGTVLGGCYQKNKWESQPDPNLAIRIMKRAVAICPDLTGGKGIEHLDVIRHAVGLRPVRKDGIRIEKEMVGSGWVVHNYGAGGGGYQTSYGAAQATVALVDEVLGLQAQL